MAIEANGDHLACIPLTGFADLAALHQLLQYLDLLFVSFSVIGIINFEVIDLKQGIVIVFDMNNVLDLAFVSCFQRFVETIRVILQ